MKTVDEKSSIRHMPDDEFRAFLHSDVYAALYDFSLTRLSFIILAVTFLTLAMLRQEFDPVFFWRVSGWSFAMLGCALPFFVWLELRGAAFTKNEDYVGFFRNEIVGKLVNTAGFSSLYFLALSILMATEPSLLFIYSILIIGCLLLVVDAELVRRAGGMFSRYLCFGENILALLYLVLLVLFIFV